MATTTSTQSRRAPSVAALVFAERVYTVLRFDFVIPVATVTGAALIVALAWSQPGPLWAAGWFAAVMASVAAWIALLVAFRRAEPDADHIRPWYQRALACVVFSGLAWGFVGLLCLLSINPNLHIAAPLVLLVIAAVVLPLLAAIFHVYAVFCALTLGLAALMLLVSGGTNALLFAGLLATAVILLLLVARQHHTLLGSALELAFRNDLALQQARDEIVRINTSNAALTTEASAYQRTRDELTQTKEAAEAATRAKSAFLANVSHEIRTPLHSIVGLANLAIRDQPPLSTQNYLTKILAAAHSLMGTVSSVLDFSKIESGQLMFEKIPFRIVDVTENVQSIFSAMALEKGLTFQVLVDPGFPPYVSGDPVRVAQIMNNFVSNAIKYTDHGTVTLDVRAISRHADRVVAKITVIDTGIGISEEQQAELLEPPARGPTAAPASNIAGMGLAICQHLAGTMNGKIGVDSEPGKGSRFWVELPFIIPSSKEIAGAGGDTVGDTVDLTGLTVLLVEDNKLNQVVAGTLLEKQGVNVVIVDNGHEAVEAVLNGDKKFDVVLMDLDMPVMDGKEATLLIREKVPVARLPIIALTANALATDMQRCLDIGMNAYLTKPIVPKDLFAAVAGATRRR